MYAYYIIIQFIKLFRYLYSLINTILQTKIMELLEIDHDIFAVERRVFKKVHGLKYLRTTIISNK